MRQIAACAARVHATTRPMWNHAARDSVRARCCHGFECGGLTPPSIGDKNLSAATAVLLLMPNTLRRTFIALTLLCFSLFQPAAFSQSPIAVRFKEGLVRGFLVLRSPEGEILASGDMTQTAQGDRVTNHLVFRFKDGSIQDETVVFTQRKTFRLLTDHLQQHGPSFKRSTNMSINALKGDVTVRYTDDNGKEQTASEHLNLPSDLANGMALFLIKNIPPGAAETKLSMVVSTPKPRLVKLVISPKGEEPFTIAGSPRTATRYLIKIELEGVAGWLAPLLGKQPPDLDLWVVGGEAPAFVKSEGPFYLGGPAWRVELTSPTWPGESKSSSSSH